MYSFWLYNFAMTQAAIPYDIVFLPPIFSSRENFGSCWLCGLMLSWPRENFGNGPFEF